MLLLAMNVVMTIIIIGCMNYESDAKRLLWILYGVISILLKILYCGERPVVEMLVCRLFACA